jgi:hypothetical protein
MTYRRQRSSVSRSWIDREDYLAWLDAECTYPFIEPEYRLGSEPSLSHSFGELVGPEKRLVKGLYGATAEGDWYDIESNSIINETHERYGDEESGWQLSKPDPAKRYVPYKTVHGPVNYRFWENQNDKANT